jgi:hypothetical protein|tara:strand:- start:340 stop:813 length:474 start_codon:yes stop_codon:yes gene_type:complete
MEDFGFSRFDKRILAVFSTPYAEFGLGGFNLCIYQAFGKTLEGIVTVFPGASQSVTYDLQIQYFSIQKYYCWLMAVVLALSSNLNGFYPYRILTNERTMQVCKSLEIGWLKVNPGGEVQACVLKYIPTGVTDAHWSHDLNLRRRQNLFGQDADGEQG